MVTLAQQGEFYKEVHPVRIRELRQQAGMTLQELADRCGVKHTAVLAWEQGKKLPRADKLPKLAAALGCKIDELFVPSQ